MERATKPVFITLIRGVALLDCDETLALEIGLVEIRKAAEPPEVEVSLQRIARSGVDADMEVLKMLPCLREWGVSPPTVKKAHLDSKYTFAIQPLFGFLMDLM